MNNLRDNNLGQLSIFILVSLMVLVLLVSIIFFSSSDEKKVLEESKASANTFHPSIIPIKEHIDFCLEKQLRRALIVGGLKGGFIYDHGEYYSPSAIPDDTYDDGFIANMDLNWNNLLFKTLIHSQSDVYSPKINSSFSITVNNTQREIYSASIKEDFERFIYEEFIECVDFESFKSNGYEIVYEKYSADVVGINSGVDPQTGKIKITAERLSGDVGDKVELRIGERIIIGEIGKLDESSSVIFLDSNSLSNVPIEEEISNLNILNRNSNVSVQVDFGDEGISAKLEFPVVLIGNDFEASYKTSITKSSVRFLDLLRLSNLLAEQKYQNKSLNLLDSDDVNNIFIKNPLPGEVDMSNVIIQRTRINASETFVREIYSLVDDESLILGNPFVFNFGYENNAPVIDYSKLNAQVLDLEGALFIVSKNQPINLDLKKITSDQQLIDNFRSYYLEDSYEGLDAKFSINSNGNLFFEGYQERRFTFPVTVTDGETKSTENFVFVTGFPDNQNNQLAKDCIEFENFEVSGVFPIADDFKDKLFTYKDGEKNILYGYSLFLGDTLNNIHSLKSSELYFKSASCLVSSSIYSVDVTLKNLDSGATSIGTMDESTGRIEVPLSPSPIEVKIEIRDRATGKLATEEYIVTIYPSECLGPHALSSTESLLFGGDLSCCNTEEVVNSITSKNPRNFFKNSILETSGVVLDAESYFCFDFAQIYTNPFLEGYSFDHTTNNIWESSSSKTSLYEGNVRAVCDGSSSIGTLAEVTPTGNTDFTAFTQKVGYERTTLPTSAPISLTKIENASECEFCYIENPSPFTMYINNDFLFFTGMKIQNLEADSVGVEPLPFSIGDESLDDAFIMCDDAWYGSEIGDYDSSSWDKLFTGEDGPPSRIYKSKGYCYQGVNQCSGRPNPIPGNFGFETDGQPEECTDWFLSPTGDFLNKGNSGRSCGINGVCQSGTCVEIVDTLRIEGIFGDTLRLDSDVNQVMNTLEILDSSGNEMCSFDRNGRIDGFDFTRVLLNFDGGNVEDESIFNNDVNAEGGIDCTDSGVSDSSCSFDGLNDFVELEGDDSFNIYPGIRTVSAWINHINAHRTITQGMSGAIVGNLNFAAGNLYFTYQDNSPRIDFSCNYPGGQNLFRNQWHHVVVVQSRNPTGGSFMKAYLNGDLICNEDLGTIASAPRNQMHLGTRNPQDSFYEGNIDEFSIYSKELTQSEVRALHSSRKALFYEEIIPIGNRDLDISGCNLRGGDEYQVRITTDEQIIDEEILVS